MDEITEEQLNWIHSLACSRLRTDANCPDVVAHFTNHKTNLAEHLKEITTAQEDELGKTAYYLVKTSDGKVIFYFSLRTGLMFEPLLSADDIMICKAFAEEIEKTEDLQKQMRDLQASMRLSNQEFHSFLTDRYSKYKSQAKMERYEKRIHETECVNLVSDTFPAIELRHFCKNESVAFDEALFPGHSLGELVFWFKVLPVVVDVMRHVGVEYMYLFAADDTEDNVLVNYYQNKLKFEGDSNYGTNKPLYDNACKFMCLHLTDALDYVDSLKRHFNPDSTADLV
jgi:hypothetical protein